MIRRTLEGRTPVLPIDIDDHRRSRTQQLLAAIAAGDPLALAEAYHRTSTAAHAVATRLVRRDEVEGLLRAAYAALWREPPVQAPLEAWVRHRVFVEGRTWLGEQRRAAVSPSTTLLLRSSPPPESTAEPVERIIAELDDDALRALLLAHDRGIPTADQRSDEAPLALRRALCALADQPDPGGCDELRLVDWVLGLLEDDEADSVALTAAAGDCSQVTRILRNGRRRLEGLPPAPDVGHRVIAYVLATATSPTPAAAVAAPDVAPAEEADDALLPAAEQPADEQPPDEQPPDDDGGLAADDVDPETALTGPATAALADGPSQAPSVLDGPITEERPAASDASDTTEREDEPGAPSDTTHVEADASLPEDQDDTDASSSPPTAPMPALASRDKGSWSTPSQADDAVRLEGEGFDEDTGGGRRAVTVILTILGGLLLLAAGAVAGLLVIRTFLG